MEWIKITDLDSLPKEEEYVLIRMGFGNVVSIYAVVSLYLQEFNNEKYPIWIDSVSNKPLDVYNLYDVTHFCYIDDINIEETGE